MKKIYNILKVKTFLCIFLLLPFCAHHSFAHKSVNVRRKERVQTSVADTPEQNLKETNKIIPTKKLGWKVFSFIAGPTVGFTWPTLGVLFGFDKEERDFITKLIVTIVFTPFFYILPFLVSLVKWTYIHFIVDSSLYQVIAEAIYKYIPKARPKKEESHNWFIEHLFVISIISLSAGFLSLGAAFIGNYRNAVPPITIFRSIMGEDNQKIPLLMPLVYVIVPLLVIIIVALVMTMVIWLIELILAMALEVIGSIFGIPAAWIGNMLFETKKEKNTIINKPLQYQKGRREVS